MSVLDDQPLAAAFLRVMQIIAFTLTMGLVWFRRSSFFSTFKKTSRSPTSMSVPDDQPLIAANLRVMQIIIFAMTMGLVFFLAIVVFLSLQEPAAPPPQPLITYLALAFAATAVPASVIVPRLMVAAARKQIAKGTWIAPSGQSIVPPPVDEAGKLVLVYQTQMIVGAALNEGAAFFALIAYLLEHSPIALGLAIVLILGVAARFPTRAKLDAWLDEQLQQVMLERQNMV